MSLLGNTIGMLLRVNSNNNSSLTLPNVQAPKNGCAYIYLSKESDVPVYFDNFNVAFNRGRLIEENHYYAYGLKITGISSKKLGDPNEGSLKNNNLYNDKEIDDEADLNCLDYGFRNYDAQIGRFVQLDPLTDETPALSGYHYALNDPITNIDEDGLSGINVLQQLACAGDKVGTGLKVMDIVSMSINAIKIAGDYGQQRSVGNQIGNALDGKTVQQVGDPRGQPKRRGLDGVNTNGVSQSDVETRLRLATEKRFLELRNKSWRHSHANIWENSLTGETWAKSTAAETVYPELALMPLPKFGWMTKLGRLFGVGIRAAEEAGETAATGVPRYLYHYTSEEYAKNITSVGLRTEYTQDGLFYLTSKGNLTPLQAQIELTMPANRALPTAILRIDVSGLNPLLIRRVTGNLRSLGAGGGDDLFLIRIFLLTL